MKKAVRPRELARRDIDTAADYYLREASLEVAIRFVDAVEASFRTISDQPSAGSPRYAHEVGLPELRSRMLKRFPYIVFYFERDDHIDVWRVLNAERDLPAWLQDAESQ